MKVLLVSSSSGSKGGGELFLGFLGRALRREGVEVEFGCAEHSRMDSIAAQWSQLGPVYRYPFRNTYDYRLRSLGHLWQKPIKGVLQAWRRLEPDVLHLNKQNLEDGLDLVVTANAMGIAKLATVHITQTQHSLGSVLGSWRDRVARQVLRRFEGECVAVSESRRQALRSFIGKKVSLVENGVEMPDLVDREGMRKEARTALGLPMDQPVFLSVGRMEAQKRPLLFLEWARSIHQQCPSCRFVWVGDGKLEVLFLEKVRQFGLDTTVRYEGWQADVHPYYLAADAMLHAADFEGLPFALLEGMARGLPVFLDPTLGRDLQWDELAGVTLVEQGGDWLRSALDERRRQELGERAKAFVSGRHSAQVMAREYMRIYQRLQEGR